MLCECFISTKLNLRTIYLHLTKLSKCVRGVSSRERGMRSVVIIYDVSSICSAGYINGIRYSCCVIFIILKTQCPILLYGGIRNVDRKS